jgi:hypothetical protein
VDYDLDWLPVRAGWVLEATTFRDFGFRDGALVEDPGLRAAAAGGREVPPGEVAALRNDPDARRCQRAEAASRALQWWKSAAGTWSRFGDLVEALERGSPARQAAALGWLRYGETACPGLDRKSYEEKVLPLVRPLAESPDPRVRGQARLLLQDRQAYGLSLTGRK